MKRIVILLLLMCVSFSGSASAFDIVAVTPETSFLDSLNRDVSSDVNFLKKLAFMFGNRYVVTEENGVDISAIDEFYAEMSKPLSLEELDTGKLKFDTSHCYNEQLRKEQNLFKILGGMSGCNAYFEPVCYFRIYRNIALVGGYSHYEKTYSNADDAYWQYVCNVENLTKERIPYWTRLTLLDKTRQMYQNIAADNRFKIFLLVDGEINSIWERSDA